MTAATTAEMIRKRVEDACSHLDDIAHEDLGDSPLVWTARLEHAARSLERAFREHREATEANGGALAVIVQEKPTLSEETADQAGEHLDLLERIESVATACEKAISFEDPNIELLRLDATIAALMVRRHLTWESVLYYEAFFRDEGGEEG